MANNHVELWLSFDDKPMHALSVPVDDCKRFAQHPLKWLRFLGYCIYGTEGNISMSDKGPVVASYETDVLSSRCYFIPDGDAALLDPDGMNDRESNISSTRANNFKKDVRDRDQRCVVTGDDDELCDAAHIIPHSKGDEYISRLSAQRGNPGDGSALDAIDDPRNGLLLATGVHRAFGLQRIAFLQTPNFALTVDDVSYNPQPEPQRVHFDPQSPYLARTLVGPTRRITVHHFALDPGSSVGLSVPHGCDIRVPTDTTLWPPPLIFDFSYGSAALAAWGMDEFQTFLGSKDGATRKLSARDWRTAKRDKPRRSTEHQGKCRDHDTMDLAMGLWMRHRRVNQGQRHDAKDVDRVRDRVEAWLPLVVR